MRAGFQSMVFARGFKIGALFVVAVLALTADFLWNPLSLGPPGLFETFEQGEVSAVRQTVAHTLSSGLLVNGGLWEDSSGRVYTSHPGMNAFWPSVLIRLTNLPLDDFMGVYTVGAAFLFALAWTIFVFRMGREFGVAVAVGVCILLAYSDCLVVAGRNASRLYHLNLWPFVLAWVLFPRVLDGRMGRGTFLGLLGLLVFIKSTCGYEFITNVILGGTVAPLYYGLARGRPWPELRRWGVQVVLAGLCGFLCAMAMNLVQTTWHFGSVQKGARVIWEKAMARTMGQESEFEDLSLAGNDAAPPGVRVAEILNEALGVEATIFPYRQGYSVLITKKFAFFFALGIPLAMVSLLDSALFPWIGRHRRELRILSAVLLWSLLCTLSWSAMAGGWTAHHLHLIGFSFYVTYMPMLFVLAARLGVLAASAAWAFGMGEGAEPQNPLPPQGRT